MSGRWLGMPDRLMVVIVVAALLISVVVRVVWMISGSTVNLPFPKPVSSQAAPVHREELPPGMPSGTGPDDPAAEVARAFVAKYEKWSVEEYSVENTGRRDKRGLVIVIVHHRADYGGPPHTGGKSFELHIDMEKKEVIDYLHYQ